MKRRRLRRLAAAVTALLVLAMLWWGNNSLSTEEYTYTSERLPDGWDGARIVVLTDLHGKQFGTDNVRLLEAVQAAKPDLIAVCGDLADEHSGVDFVPALMRGLVAIAPTYYVSGNHEWAAGLMPALRQIFQQTGVTYLHNTAVTAERGGDTIVLAGIDDPNGYADQKTPEQVAADVYGTYGEPFWLLLAHRNNLFSGEYCRLGADLTLSGHGHGGIWRLPWSNEGLFGAHGVLFPSFTNGLYRCTDGDTPGAAVFVSRGLGANPHFVPRIFNRPEVAVVILQKAS